MHKSDPGKIKSVGGVLSRGNRGMEKHNEYGNTTVDGH